MSATPKPKQPSKNAVLKALMDQNAKLIEDNELLTTALVKEQSGDIKLPHAPSVGQVNRIIDWVAKIKAYYASVNDLPEKMETSEIKELTKLEFGKYECPVKSDEEPEKMIEPEETKQFEESESHVN